ncbi:MAG: peptide ABC transporter substrate-binding protein [Chlamydiales bacterium]|nr:peptide ABC transporter substrate-binding protein [Chlamydiales bacterium]
MTASQIHFMLYEGLLRLNPDMSLSLAQAESYEISPDHKTYTFHLKNTLWSDGSPVTAYDFEKTWKSILDPNFFSPDSYLLYSIKNAKSAKEGKLPLNQVAIQAKTAKTLVIELETPTPYFLQIVASSVLLPVNTEKDQSAPDWATQPEQLLSNGPFQLKSWKFNQQMIFEKNPRYHEETKVNLNHIFIDIIEQEKTAFDMYINGHFDLMGTPLSFFPHELIDDLKKEHLLTFYPVANTKFLAFNTSCAPFHNSNIRRAFAYAIDRKSIVDHITKLNEKEALTIIPPVLFPQDSAPFSDGDPLKAREYFQKGIDELQLKDIDRIIFMYVSSNMNHTLAQALQKIWFHVLGIHVDLQPVEFKTLHERSATGDFSIGLFAWVADYGDSMNILERFIDKNNHRNYPKWENHAYNHLLEEARQATTSSQYLKKIKEAERLLIDEMPFTCLFHENYTFLIHPRVKGFAVSPLGHIYFDQITLD